MTARRAGDETRRTQARNAGGRVKRGRRRSDRAREASARGGVGSDASACARAARRSPRTPRLSRTATVATATAAAASGATDPARGAARRARGRLRSSRGRIDAPVHRYLRRRKPHPAADGDSWSVSWSSSPVSTSTACSLFTRIEKGFEIAAARTGVAVRLRRRRAARTARAMRRGERRHESRLGAPAPNPRWQVCLRRVACWRQHW